MLFIFQFLSVNAILPFLQFKFLGLKLILHIMLIMDENNFEIDNLLKTRFKISKHRIITSLFVIPYVWLLPLLSKYGFAESPGYSISEFIANPHATGALAALSFSPLILMWEYQSYLLEDKKYDKQKCTLDISLSSYQFFYGSFLVCTVNYVPFWLHFLTVFLFSFAFVIHSFLIMYHIKLSIGAKIDLSIGCCAAFFLLFVKGISFWLCECIGFSSMILFTPIEVMTNQLNIN
tara:strand:- start:1624 stop:2325 length:702 start_codon:yes stop_codon:yes gene_type:complete